MTVISARARIDRVLVLLSCVKDAAAAAATVQLL